MSEHNGAPPSILILATDACAYPAADYVGQMHAGYATNTYILRVLSPVIFPEAFYLHCFDQGIGGIIVMSCGAECPYKGAYDRLAGRIDVVRQKMKERKINPDRLRLCAVCTVCARPFLNEIKRMTDIVVQHG